MRHPRIRRPKHVITAAIAIRLGFAAALTCTSPIAAAHSPSAAGRWACDLNGRDIDIRIAGDEATVTLPGAPARVLKRREVRSGAYYTDGTVALKHRGDQPAQVNEPQWVQNGEASALRRCIPAAG